MTRRWFGSIIAIVAVLLFTVMSVPVSALELVSGGENKGDHTISFTQVGSDPGLIKVVWTYPELMEGNTTLSIKVNGFEHVMVNDEAKQGDTPLLSEPAHEVRFSHTTDIQIVSKDVPQTRGTRTVNLTLRFARSVEFDYTAVSEGSNVQSLSGKYKLELIPGDLDSKPDSGGSGDNSGGGSGDNSGGSDGSGGGSNEGGGDPNDKPDTGGGGDIEWGEGDRTGVEMEWEHEAQSVSDKGLQKIWFYYPMTKGAIVNMKLVANGAEVLNFIDRTDANDSGAIEPNKKTYTVTASSGTLRILDEKWYQNDKRRVIELTVRFSKGCLVRGEATSTATIGWPIATCSFNVSLTPGDEGDTANGDLQFAVEQVNSSSRRITTNYYGPIENYKYIVWRIWIDSNNDGKFSDSELVPIKNVTFNSTYTQAIFMLYKQGNLWPGYKASVRLTSEWEEGAIDNPQHDPSKPSPDDPSGGGSDAVFSVETIVPPDNEPQSITGFGNCYQVYAGDTFTIQYNVKCPTDFTASFTLSKWSTFNNGIPTSDDTYLTHSSVRANLSKTGGTLVMEEEGIYNLLAVFTNTQGQSIQTLSAIRVYLPPKAVLERDIESGSNWSAYARQQVKLSSSQSTAADAYPGIWHDIDHAKDTVEVRPLDGQSLSSIYLMDTSYTDREMGTQSSNKVIFKNSRFSGLSGSIGNYRALAFTEPGRYEISLTVYNTAGKSGKTTGVITVSSEVDLGIQAYTPAVFYRDINNSNKATIDIVGPKESANDSGAIKVTSSDGSRLKELKVDITFDADNNGVYTDAVDKTSSFTKSGQSNGIKCTITDVVNQNGLRRFLVSLETPNIGKYRIFLSCEKDDKSVSIPILPPAETKVATLELFTEVDNTAPSAKYHANPIQKVDVVLATGQLREQKSYETYMNTLRQKLNAPGNYIDAEIEEVETTSIDITSQNPATIMSEWKAWTSGGTATKWAASGGALRDMEYHCNRQGWFYVPPDASFGSGDIKYSGTITGYSTGGNSGKYGNPRYNDFYGLTWRQSADSNNYYAIVSQHVFTDCGCGQFPDMRTSQGKAADGVFLVKRQDGKDYTLARFERGGWRPGQPFNVSVQMVGNQITATINGVTLKYYDPNPIPSGGYGIIAVSHQSGDWKNLKFECGNNKSLGDAVSDVAWRDGALRFIIHATDIVPEDMKDFTSVDFLNSLTKVVQSNSYVANMGTSANRSVLQRFTDMIQGPDGSVRSRYWENSPATQQLNSVGDWIIDVVRSVRKPSNYVLVNTDLQYNTEYSDTNRDTALISTSGFDMSKRLEAEKWKYRHLDKFFDNSGGRVAYSNIWITDPVTSFNTVGLYRVNYKRKDNPFAPDSKESHNFNPYRYWSYNYDDNISSASEESPLLLQSSADEIARGAITVLQGWGSPREELIELVPEVPDGGLKETLKDKDFQMSPETKLSEEELYNNGTYNKDHLSEPENESDDLGEGTSSQESKKSLLDSVVGFFVTDASAAEKYELSGSKNGITIKGAKGKKLSRYENDTVVAGPWEIKDATWTIPVKDLKLDFSNCFVKNIKVEKSGGYIVITWDAAEYESDLVFGVDGSDERMTVKLKLSPMYAVQSGWMFGETASCTSKESASSLRVGDKITITPVYSGVDGGEKVYTIKAEDLFKQICRDDTATTKEDEVVLIDFMANDEFDSDFDAPSLKSVEVVEGSGYTFQYTAEMADEEFGSGHRNSTYIKFLPDTNFTGTVKLKYVYQPLRSDLPESGAVITIKVTPVNDPPSGVNLDSDVFADLQFVAGATTVIPFSYFVDRCSDVDNPKSDLRVAWVGNCSAGQVNLVSNGVEIVPVSNFSGQLKFQWTVSDGQAASAAYEAYVNVSNMFVAPVALADHYNLDIGDSPFRFFVLSNDLMQGHNDVTITSAGQVKLNGLSTTACRVSVGFEGSTPVVELVQADQGKLAAGDVVSFTYSIASEADLSKSTSATADVTLRKPEVANDNEGYIYVHRRPIADFGLRLQTSGSSIVGAQVTDEASYDLDHSEMHPGGNTVAPYSWKGVRGFRWSVKTDDSSWQVKVFDADSYGGNAASARSAGLGWVNSQIASAVSSTNLNSHVVYVSEAVQDIDGENNSGVWSEDYIVAITNKALPPIARFSLSSDRYYAGPGSSFGSEFDISDKSYSPCGRNLSKWDWEMSFNNGQKIAESANSEQQAVERAKNRIISTVANIFSPSGYANKDPEFKISLTVTDSAGVKSDPYTVTFKVFKKNQAPVVIVPDGSAVSSLDSSTLYEIDDGADGKIGDDFGKAGNTSKRGVIDFSRLLQVTDDQLSSIRMDYTFDGQYLAKRKDYRSEATADYQHIYSNLQVGRYPFSRTVTEEGFKPGAYKLTVTVRDNPDPSIYGPNASETSVLQTEPDTRPFHLFVVPKIEGYPHYEFKGYRDGQIHIESGKTLDEMGVTDEDVAPSIGEAVTLVLNTNTSVTAITGFYDFNRDGTGGGVNEELVEFHQAGTNPDGTTRWECEFMFEEVPDPESESDVLSRCPFMLEASTNWGSETGDKMRTKGYQIDVMVLPVKLYDFNVQYVSDPDITEHLPPYIAADGHRAELGGVPAGDLGLDNSVLTTGMRKGYSFYFEIWSKGLQNDNDFIRIKPRFFEVKQDVNGVTSIGNELTAYLQNKDRSWTSMQDTSNEYFNKSFALYYEGERIHLLGSHAQVDLPIVLRTKKGSEQVWKGRYGIPGSTRFAPTGTVLSDSTEYKGDVLVTFEFIAMKKGQERYNYIAKKQWMKERTEYPNGTKGIYSAKEDQWRSAGLNLGSTVVYDVLKSVEDEYGASPVWED